MIAFLVAVHERLLGAFQAAYDYAWDRWGLYAGTYRLIWIGLAMSGPSFVHGVLIGSLGGGAARALVHLIAAGIILVLGVAWFAFHSHLRERREQKAGHFKVLNARAQRDRMLAPFWLGCTAMLFWAICPALNYDDPINALERMAQGILFAGYGYATCVMVRPRNETRFATLERGLAFSGA